jgi:microcystin degradation protein MlrC
MRILIAGFQHETNTFATSEASYESFVRGEGYPPLCRGTDIFDLRDINIPVAGFMNAAGDAGHELMPVIWAAACPSGPVRKDAYERIAGEIVDAARMNSIDAVYLDFHGAMVAQHTDDGEGELLERIRAAVGPDTPIVATLDLHANVTARMLRAADGLIAYRTYPHVDMAEAGKRAASFLDKWTTAKSKLFCAYRRLPFLIPINAMCTSLEPACGVYQWIAAQENSSIISLSFTPGFPAADFPECGPVLWGYGTNAHEIEQLVDAFYSDLVRRENEWSVKFYEPDDAVLEAQKIAKHATRPVVIADTQDNPGAGGDSNTMGMLRALIRCRAEGAALGLIHDPRAAQLAHAAGVGVNITLSLGGEFGSSENAPLLGTFLVEHLSDGKCRFDGPMLHGVVTSLGLVACLKIDDIRIVVSSVKSQMLDRNLYRIGGVEPEKMKILVNKSSVHNRADFEPIAEAMLVAKSPGAFIADPAELPWKNLRPGLRTSPGGKEFH